MIAPLVPFAIKGAIWYQGESNAGRAHQYRTLFPDMIRNWRQDWNRGISPSSPCNWLRSKRSNPNPPKAMG